jgi:hypothetical protein
VWSGAAALLLLLRLRLLPEARKSALRLRRRRCSGAERASEPERAATLLLLAERGRSLLESSEAPSSLRGRAETRGGLRRAESAPSAEAEASESHSTVRDAREAGTGAEVMGG